MAEPFTSKRWALWVQPGGPNTAIYYLGCHTIDDLEEDFGGLKDLIRCFKTDGTGWEVRGHTRNPAEAISTTVTGLVETSASWLERIVEGANCPFPLYINGKTCPPYDVFGGADRWYALENTLINSATVTGLAHREEDNVSEQSFAVTAYPPMVRGRAVRSDRITVTGTENWNAIASCSTPSCAGDCGDAVGACQTLVAVADGDPASADVWISYDYGATWTATAADPYSGPITDQKAVGCFALDSDTSRILTVREAVTTATAAVYYSDDWGATWTEVLLDTPVNYGATRADGLFVLDANHIWVAVSGAGGSEVHFSDDGGLTWTEQVTPLGVFTVVHFADANTGMIAGLADATATTTDGGATWTAATATGSGDGISAITENDGTWWVGTTSTGGELYYSTDHGVTWAQRAFPGDGGAAIYGIDFSSPTVGYMTYNPTAATAIIYRTRDGGLTWEAVSGTIPGELFDIHVCGPNLAFAVGEISTTALVYKVHD